MFLRILFLFAARRKKDLITFFLCWLKKNIPVSPEIFYLQLISIKSFFHVGIDKKRSDKKNDSPSFIKDGICGKKKPNRKWFDLWSFPPLIKIKIFSDSLIFNLFCLLNLYTFSWDYKIRLQPKENQHLLTLLQIFSLYLLSCIQTSNSQKEIYFTHCLIDG